MKIILAKKIIIPTNNYPRVVGNSLGHDLTMSHGKYYNLVSDSYLEGLGSCVGLTAWAGKNKFIANSAPELESLKNIDGNITKIIENLRGKLKNSFDEVHAFITGGIKYDPNIKGSKESFNLIEELYESLFRQGVPTTVIAGQKGDGLKTRINSKALADNIFISGKPVDEIILSAKEEHLSKDILEEQFDFVELLDNMPVKIEK